MRAWGAVRTAVAVFLLCAWGGVLSCSNGSENGGNNGNNEGGDSKIIILTFDANGGSAVAPESIQTLSGETVRLPDIEGDAFSHWNTKADGSGASYQESASFTESVILYAIYLKEGEHKIIYNLGGGVNNSKNPRIYREGENLKLLAPTREGYTFSCWKDKNDETTDSVSSKDSLEFTAVWVWKINEGKSGFVGASSGSNPNKEHDNYPGYEGAYIDGLGGGYVDYAVHSDEAQDVTILLRYAYWGYKHELRGAQIVVNGKTDEDIIYCNWTNGKNTADIWQDSNEITVHLEAGDNALRVVPVPKGTKMDETLAKYPDDAEDAKKTWTADGNLPNIDYLQITGKGLSAAIGDVPAYYQVKVSGDFGTVDIEPKQAFYAKGADITVTATPKDGYRFDAWLGTRASNDKEWTLTVTEELDLAAHFVPMDYNVSDDMVGYATITDDSGTKYTISGGAGGKTIEIVNLNALKENAARLSCDDPYIVYFTSGERITTVDNESEYYTIGSNKTIYGKVKGAGLKNIEMRVTGSNVIIRNMVFGEVIGDDRFGGTGNDALSLNGAKHVWVDHCEMSSQLEPKNNDGTDAGVTDKEAKKDWYDGLLDVKNGAAWITVSNCYFHDHWKAVLCGSGDDHDDGDSAMRITFYGNYWKDINSRQPLFRWGKAHIYNSYFHSEASGISGESTGINCRAESDVYIDNNYFENIKTPIGYYNDETKSKTGHWVNKDNKFDKCTNAVASSPTTYTPPYIWKPTSAETAKANVVTNAGVGKLSAADLQ